jgi:hypothetical protein
MAFSPQRRQRLPVAYPAASCLMSPHNLRGGAKARVRPVAEAHSRTGARERSPMANRWTEE